ncbi:hypothetical protein B0H14DRAFT_2584946 [Mycena olivaceomarginata]|nr:hypothetical protein B0H14DRAFT_2584946 [Mycena olivaceomarginata]
MFPDFYSLPHDHRYSLIECFALDFAAVCDGTRVHDAWDDPFSSASASNEAPKSDATPSHPSMYRVRTASSTTIMKLSRAFELFVQGKYMQLVAQGFVLGSGFSIPGFSNYKHV